MIAAILILVWRLHYLQIVRGAELLKRAREQQVALLTPYIPRRQIIDSQKNVLATDELHYTLYIHPRFFTETTEIVAQKLASILTETAESELVARFKNQATGIRLANNLPEHIAEQIRAFKFNGVELEEQYSRFYPQAEMLAEVTGYVNGEHQGQAGIEYSQESIIQNNLSSESLEVRRTGQGKIIPAAIPSNLIKIDDLKLQLTVNLRLQKVARTALRKQMKRYRAKRGAVIVMDVNNGSILALVCEPIYDPNNYQEYAVELFKNWAITDLYEPGSTFKPINVAIALEKGVIEPNTTVYDPGKLKIDVWEVKNHDYSTEGANGVISIAQILQRSSNVGMIQIMKRIDPKEYYQYLKTLGLDTKVGVDLPSDTPPSLKPKVEFLIHEIEPATTAFGQGFAVTPLKLLQLNAILANGGKIVTPHVVEGLVDAAGQFHWQPTYSTRQVLSPETTQAVLEMMETVVTEGSGSPALIPGYRIAGKTGTSQKASGGGYHSSARITSFVGILPVSSPRYAVLAVIDEPVGELAYGSTVTAPIVGEVMQSLIAIEGIPPDGTNKIKP
ncbi:penicillin-binding protein 2 [Gloeocapsa sp. PCC 73106]|uniref:peptidoglycan D,D-transpeptidase FtsI family protein n=1 Tax=Gloeocapsa sp. PCC 73106 TaxID=102232 RepID=UPI001EE67BF3|nr:penicillin-binding protein 2 [Gloeocapsa sp. PCC 73106]